MTRDRQATEQKILDAVGRLLVQAGFQTLGINAVAREAGVDKVLIYRYFGGLSELLEAFGRSADFWWEVDDLIGDHLPPPEEDTPGAWVSLVYRRHLDAIRNRPVTQAILAWELVADNALTATLAEIRESRSAELVQRLQAKLGRTADPRWRAVSALLGAACNYLIVRAATVDRFGGVPLQSPEGWHELEAGLDLIVHRVFADGKTATAAAPPREAGRTAATRDDWRQW